MRPFVDREIQRGLADNLAVDLDDRARWTTAQEQARSNTRRRFELPAQSCCDKLNTLRDFPFAAQLAAVLCLGCGRLTVRSRDHQFHVVLAVQTFDRSANRPGDRRFGADRLASEADREALGELSLPSLGYAALIDDWRGDEVRFVCRRDVGGRAEEPQREPAPVHRSLRMIASSTVGRDTTRLFAAAALASLSSIGCMLNPDWDGCLGADPCGGSTYCDRITRECVDRPALPSELEDLPPGEWTPISKNFPLDVVPCPSRDCGYAGPNGPSAVFNGWSGSVYASGHGPYGGLVAWGAGSTDYSGNEVYFFDLADLEWRRLSEPTQSEIPGDPAAFGADPETCLWWDGAPIPMESQASPAYASRANAFVLPRLRSSGGGAPRTDGTCSSGRGVMFSLADGTWSPLGDSVDTAPIDNVPSAYDVRTDTMWSLLEGSVFGAYSFNDAQWLIHRPPASFSGPAVATIVPELDAFVVADFRGDRVAALSLEEPWAAMTTLTTQGDTEIESEAGSGFSWSPSLTAVVAWPRGPAVYLLRPPQGDWRVEAWTWERVEFDGTPPVDPVAGVYGRLQWVEAINAAVIVSGIDQPIFAARLP